MRILQITAHEISQTHQAAEISLINGAWTALTLLLARIGLVPPKHLLQPVADRIAPSFMAGAICPKITPGNARKPLLDLVLANFLRLPPCDLHQRQRSSDK